jgi:hypothetical protein
MSFVHIFEDQLADSPYYFTTGWPLDIAENKRYH